MRFRWRLRREIDEELRAHLQMAIDDRISRGQSPAAAAAAAKRELGNEPLVRETTRDVWGGRWIEEFTQDVRLACRSLARAPWFTAMVVGTLALGIGSNVAIYSVVEPIVLKALPYPGGDSLVRLAMTFNTTSGGQRRFAAPVSFEDLEFLRTRARSVSHLGTYSNFDATLTGREGVAYISASRISPVVLAMLETTPALGRLFEDREESQGRDRVAILSHGTWQRRFGADPQILGASILLDGVDYQIVGVMPASFRFPDADTELWIPFPAWGSSNQPMIVGRLTAGASFRTASDEVDALLKSAHAARQQRRDGPAPPSRAGGPPPPPPPPQGPGPAVAESRVEGDRIEKSRRFVVQNLHEESVAGVRTSLAIVSAAAGFVLLIACVNVGGLLLARGLKRDREMWMRLALGAGRGRLVRQIVTESVLLAVAGGTAGVLLAAAGVRALRTYGTALPRPDLAASSIVPRLETVGINGKVLLFSILLSVTVGTVCGLVPALWQTRPRTRRRLDREATSTGPGFNLFRRSRGRALLLTVQISLALILLLGSGLLVRSFLKLTSVNLGYDAKRVLTFQVPLPADVAALPFSERLAEHVRALPGVASVGYADHLPLSRTRLGHALLSASPPSSPIQGQGPPLPPPPGASGTPEFPIVHLVSRDFLATLGVPVVRGRGFSDRDRGVQPGPLLVNRRLADSGFLKEGTIGTRVYTGGEIAWDIIGIVDDIRGTGLANPPSPEIFANLEGTVEAASLFEHGSPYFAVRTGDNPTSLIPAIRSVVARIDSRLAPERIATMDEIAVNSVLQPRFYAVALGLLAFIAVTLAVVGIYGGIAFAVSSRTREIGIRTALGASKLQVFGAIGRDALLVAGLGLAVGVLGGAAVTRYLEGMLFGLTPLDPTVFVVAPLVFGLAILIAAIISARPALGVSPLASLRHE